MFFLCCFRRGQAQIRSPSPAPARTQIRSPSQDRCVPRASFCLALFCPSPSLFAALCRSLAALCRRLTDLLIDSVAFLCCFRRGQAQIRSLSQALGRTQIRSPSQDRCVPRASFCLALFCPSPSLFAALCRSLAALCRRLTDLLIDSVAFLCCFRRGQAQIRSLSQAPAPALTPSQSPGRRQRLRRSRSQGQRQRLRRSRSRP